MVSEYEYDDGNIHLKTIDGDVYLQKDDSLIPLTAGYKLPCIEFVADTADKTYFKCDGKKYYFDKKENIIIFEENKMNTTTKDHVNHPSHYTDGKIEVIDFIEDKKLNYHRGNAIKYIARAGKKHKNKEIEDLQKAIWYLNREIDRLKKAE